MKKYEEVWKWEPLIILTEWFNASEIYTLVPVRFNHKNVGDPLTHVLLNYHLMIYTLVNDHITAIFPTASPKMRFALNYN